MTAARDAAETCMESPTLAEESAQLLSARLESVKRELQKHHEQLESDATLRTDAPSRLEPRAEQRRRAAGALRTLRARLRQLRADVDTAFITLDETAQEMTRLRGERMDLTVKLDVLREENLKVKGQLEAARRQVSRSADDADRLLRDMWEFRREREGFREAGERVQLELLTAQDALRQRDEQLQALEKELASLKEDRDGLAYMLSWQKSAAARE
ncbi:MAG: hypothetical protein AB2A00_39255 [Myxococcota bacterium]